MTGLLQKTGKVLAVLASTAVLLVGSCGEAQLAAEPVELDVRIVTVSCWDARTHQLLGSAAAALVDGSRIDLRCQDRLSVRIVPE